jgi:PAS domain S-box-containing protein
MSQENEQAITADRDGVIRHWGREAENIFGYTPEEALGRKVDLIIPPVLHARHWRGFDKAVNSGQLKRPGKTLKVPAVHRSGAIVPISGSLALTRADDGTVDGATLTLFGRGSAWAAAAWRAVLAPLKLAQSVRGRTQRSTE